MTKRPAIISALTALLFAAAGASASNTADLRPSPPEYWNQGKYLLDATLSGSYLRGNVDNSSLSGGIDFTARPAARHQLSLNAAAGYASFNGSTLLDTLKATGLYAYSLNPHLNAFFMTTHAKNRSVTLDYRSTTGVGVCVHNFLTDIFQPVLFSLAVTPEHEAWADGTHDNATRGMARLNFKAPLSQYALLGGDFVYAPDLDAFSDYRYYAETFLQFKITPREAVLPVHRGRRVRLPPAAGRAQERPVGELLRRPAPREIAGLTAPARLARL